MDITDSVSSEQEDEFIKNVVWNIWSTHHIVLSSIPDAVILGWDTAIGIPYSMDWKTIEQCRQEGVDQNTVQKNARRINFYYVVDGYRGPYILIQVHVNGVIRIQHKFDLNN